MNLFTRLGALPLLAVLAVPGLAQEPAQPPAAAPTTAAPAPTGPAPAVASPVQTPPPVDPKIIEDGGLSIEPIYWFNRQQPKLRGGATALASSDFDYTGNAKNSIGGELGIPAGRANTLRFSYFRIQGNSNSTLAGAQTLFSESYLAGDYLAGSYRLQSAKISWDYLSYTWYRPTTKIRFKTLYEVQYVTISTTISAPFKAVTEDSSGNVDYFVANGSTNLFLPTFGGEFEGEFGKHVRWQAKASGFGLPHRANIGDIEASLAFRVIDSVEIIAGEKVFHFKTSPKGDQYWGETLQGAFVGVRYYWGGRQ